MKKSITTFFCIAKNNKFKQKDPTVMILNGCLTDKDKIILALSALDPKTLYEVVKSGIEQYQKSLELTQISNKN